MVNVEIDSLKRMKRALSEFSADISGLSSRVRNDVRTIREDCTERLSSTKREMEESEAYVETLTKRIKARREKIGNMTVRLNSAKKDLEQAERDIMALENITTDLRSQITALYAQLSDAEGDQKDHIRSLIAKLESDLRVYESKKRERKAERNNLDKLIKKLKSEINDEKELVSQDEESLSAEKRRLDNIRSKLERLRSAFNRLEQNLVMYESAAARFESKAISDTDHNKNALSRCISSVEEYLSVNISGSGNGSGSGSVSSIQFGSPLEESMRCAPGEYHYERGERNIRHVYGQLKLVEKDDRVRDSTSQRDAGGDRRRDDDDGGHIIASMFGGAPDERNLFPQNRNLNRSGYRRLEKEWESYLRDNCSVYVNVFTSASNDMMREDAIYGSYVVIKDGEIQREEHFSLENESRQTQEAWEEDVYNNS